MNIVNIDKGYVDYPVPEGIDLRKEIDRLRKDKNAVILAHYYQSGDLQDMADFVGDSLALAQWASRYFAYPQLSIGIFISGLPGFTLSQLSQGE